MKSQKSLLFLKQNYYTMPKKKIGKILAVDDNTDILFALKLLLKTEVELIDTLDDPNRLVSKLQEDEYDVILLDMNFTKDASSGQEGFYWLNKILEFDPAAIVIFITAYSDVNNAVKAIKDGASDFIIKPWQNEKLIATIMSGIKLRRSRIEINSLKQKQSSLNTIINQPFEDFLGVSPSMQKVFETIKKVAKTDASVLILGENGTGKELVARALHTESIRYNEIFVNVDLGAITETLFESELFGHIKGAFTDARNERIGRFELASGGTIFLDEIANISLPAQAKLLTVLERREIVRVGSNKPVPIDIRLISATNGNLPEMISSQAFREDLLYRLNTVEIHLPPLRERMDDIALLANHYLSKFAKKYNKRIRELSAPTIKHLQSYSWPGNVRELRHTIERAVILAESSVLQPSDFQLNYEKKAVDELELENYDLDHVEKTIIEKVLKKHGGNISLAAKELGLTRTSLYRRLEKHGL
jgi:DNA-binding NtrC family response regulator